MISHPLHKYIGDLVTAQNFDKVLKDTTCGRDCSLPLFYDKKSQETEFCDVDMIILKDDKVKVSFMRSV